MSLVFKEMNDQVVYPVKANLIHEKVFSFSFKWKWKQFLSTFSSLLSLNTCLVAEKFQ